jgi:hypothetical protein
MTLLLLKFEDAFSRLEESQLYLRALMPMTISHTDEADTY